MDETIKVILEQGGHVSGLSILMITAILFVVSFQKEWLYLPGPVKAKDKIIADQEKALNAANEELREQDRLMARLEAEKDLFYWESSQRTRPRTQRKPREER